MHTHGSSSSSPSSSPPGRNDKPRFDNETREATFHVDGLSCRHCAKRAAETLRSFPGIVSATVSFSTATAHVCHDARFTHEREIIVNMAQRGFWLSPLLGGWSTRVSWFDAPRLGIVLALLGNLIALALWPPAQTAPKLPWVELVFALLLVLAAAPPLVTRAYVHAKRGIWGADFAALVTTFVALVVGLAGTLFTNQATIPLTPNFLLRFGTRPDGASALAFEAAGAVVGFAFLGNQVQRSVLRKAFADVDRAMRYRYARVRRVMAQGGDVFVPCALASPGDRLRVALGEVILLDLRLDVAARVVAASGRVEDRLAGQMVFRGERLASAAATGRLEYVPPIDTSVAADAEATREALRIEDVALRRDGNRVESIAAVALTIATVWFGVFAVIVHALAGRQALHPGVTLAGVAVLAGASPMAFALGLSFARIMAVMRARAVGIVVKNVGALQALATVDCAFFDLTDHVYLDAPLAFRALWHRTIACRLLSSENPEVAAMLGHRFGVATSCNLDLEDKMRIVAETRAAGGRVLHVGRYDTARMIPVDVAVAIAPNTLPSSVAAGIVLRDSSLMALVWLIDLARSLRARTRFLFGLTLGYEAIVIPLCVAGVLAPLTAAALSFVLTLVNCTVALRIGKKPRAATGYDKRFSATNPVISDVFLGQRSPATARGPLPSDKV